MISLLVYVIVLGAMSYYSRTAWMGLFVGFLVFVGYAIFYIRYVFAARLSLYWFDGIDLVPFLPAVLGGFLITLIARAVRETEVLGFVSFVIATASLIGLFNVVLPIPDRTFSIYLTLGIEVGAIMFQLFNFED